MAIEKGILFTLTLIVLCVYVQAKQASNDQDVIRVPDPLENALFDFVSFKYF